MKYLAGKKQISDYVGKSWKVILNWINTREFPCACLGGRWESSEDLINKWKQENALKNKSENTPILQKKKIRISRKEGEREAMNDREFEFLRERFVLKESLSVIGDKHGMTREGVRGVINRTLDSLIPQKYFETWKEKNDFSSYDDPLLALIFCMEYKDRHKLSHFLKEWKIKHPADILKLSQRDIVNTRMMGPALFLKLRIALLKMGFKYGKDDLESLERQCLQLNLKKENGFAGIKLRFKILERDGFTCQYCGRNPRDEKGLILQVDHIQPVCAGGSWEETNLITSCRECNLGKLDVILKNRSIKSF